MDRRSRRLSPTTDGRRGAGHASDGIGSGHHGKLARDAGRPSRELPDRVVRGRGRHGGRLPGRARDAGARGGDQGAAARVLAQPRDGQPLLQRGAGDRAAPASRHHRGLRLRLLRRRRGLHRDGAAPGREPEEPARARGQAALAARGLLRPPGRAGAGHRPPGADRPPRPEARQRVPAARSGARRRAGEGPRLRHRQAGVRHRRQRDGEDPRGRRHGHARVHVAAAVPRRRRGRSPRRHLLARLHAVRDGVRTAAVRRRGRRRPADRAHDPAPADAALARAERVAGARGDHLAQPGQGGGRAPAVDGRAGR